MIDAVQLLLRQMILWKAKFEYGGKMAMLVGLYNVVYIRSVIDI